MDAPKLPVLLTRALTADERTKLCDPVANAQAAVNYIERRYNDAGQSLKDWLNEEHAS